MAGESAKTGLGATVPRVEDERLLTGRGRYVDDLSFPGMTFAYVLRSPHAHARICSINTEAALASPGVLTVLTGEDVIRERLAGIPCDSFPDQVPGDRGHCPAQPVLVADKVRHVGDRVALIVAETLAQAKDAAERIAVSYTALAAVTLRDAARPGTAKVWDEAEDNTSFQLEFGNRREVDKAFAASFHTTKIRVHYPRTSANSIEPRVVLAHPSATDGRLTLYSSTQSPFSVREVVSDILAIPELDLRVVAMDVGGAFGMKGQTYPEEVLAVWVAAKLGRPVKWTAERSEALASDMHGRHQIAESELALDREGHVIAFRTSVAIDVGAYLSHSAGVPPHNAGVSYPGTYRVPQIHASVRAMFTNTAQLGPYRGSGKPEASFVLERLIEKAGREMGINAIDLRRRNLIRPSDMPYKTPGGNVYDCGDFERVLNKALALADWQGFAARRAQSDRHGLRRGIGLSMHCQRAGTFSERMEVRVAPDGSAALYVGTLSTGQGHETMFAQMVSEWLALGLDRVRVFQGDTDQVLYGRGTFAQRSMSAGGSALRLAVDDVIRKGRRFAAWMLEVAEADIVFEDGTFRVFGTDLQVGFCDVAQKSYAGRGVPQELGIGLDGVGAHEGPNTYPNGCIVCEVVVDPDTGVITVDRFSAVDDVGLAVNPLTLHGQLHGSVAQGLGEALIEQVVYDRDNGQLLTGSFLDYGMPRADIIPDIAAELALVPTKTNLLGVKGGSEAGNVATPAAIVNAVLDALSPWGIEDLPLPATPERVWRSMQRAAAS